MAGRDGQESNYSAATDTLRSQTTKEEKVRIEEKLKDFEAEAKTHRTLVRLKVSRSSHAPFPLVRGVS